MGNRWDGVQLKDAGFGEEQDRQQQHLTDTNIAGLVSKETLSL